MAFSVLFFFQGEAGICQQQKIITSGNYQGAEWHIDQKHLLWWDKKPYIPFSYNHIWIDFDHFTADESELAFKYFDKLTTDLTSKGETYFILFLTHPKIKNIHDFTRVKIREQFEREWKKFAPAVTKKGLRAMTFFNEINTFVDEESAKDPQTVQKIGSILGEYGKSMKKIVADVPVILKVVGDWNVAPIMAAVKGDFIDGLGGDFFSSEADAELTRQMKKPLQILEESKKTKLFWITEFSRIAGEEPNVYWPAFKSKKQMKEFMEKFIYHGATGFFYFPIDKTQQAWKSAQGFARVTKETAQWFKELQSEMAQRIIAP